MKVEFIAEPELEFCAGRRHVDVRFGLAKYGPLDRGAARAPTEIRVGIVGTAETVEKLSAWLDRCRREISAKESRQPNLFPAFPGFSRDGVFGAQLVLDRTLCASIPQREIAAVIGSRSRSIGTEQSVDLFFEHCRSLREKNASIVICAPPDDLLDYLDGEAPRESAVAEDDRVDEAVDHNLPQFHDLLKAHALSLVVPVQMIRRETYDQSAKKAQKKRPWRVRVTQDEATRAWNLHTALYYKAGGNLWRLARDRSEYSTCFVGVAFYRSTDSMKIMSSMAQIFNERGDGIVIRGAPARVFKEDRRPHLDEKGASQLLQLALQSYRQEHKNAPARVVIHKTSDYTPEELSGFSSAAEEARVEFAELLSVGRSLTKLFRVGTYPPLRGTFLSLDEQSHMLYTKGSRCRDMKFEHNRTLRSERQHTPA
jgi:hypothetical protein